MKKIHVIAGPTASGKSAFAIKMAQEMNGVIINADSLQLYDALPILSASPSANDLSAAKHVLYGDLNPNEACSAGNWRELAAVEIGKAFVDNRTPIVVGGSGLYLKALMQGLSPIPDIPREVRQKSCDEFIQMGADEFFKRLAMHDETAGQKLHKNHKARILRAWEVLEFTGRSIYKWQELAPQGALDDWSFDVKIIMPPRDALHERCNSRFVKMLEMGALEEARLFSDRIKNGEILKNCPPTKAIGFAQLVDFIDGKTTKECAIADSQTATRRYAKRQITWLRHQLHETKSITVTIVE